jgi:hypothetical protein
MDRTIARAKPSTNARPLTRMLFQNLDPVISRMAASKTAVGELKNNGRIHPAREATSHTPRNTMTLAAT